jgi:hypothetical protein
MATVDLWTDDGGDDTESIIKVWHEFLYGPTPIFNITVEGVNTCFGVPVLGYNKHWNQ